MRKWKKRKRYWETRAFGYVFLISIMPKNIYCQKKYRLEICRGDVVRGEFNDDDLGHLDKIVKEFVFDLVYEEFN